MNNFYQFVSSKDLQIIAYYTRRATFEFKSFLIFLSIGSSTR